MGKPGRRAEEDLDLADIVVQLRGLRTASQKRRYRGAPPPRREAGIAGLNRLLAETGTSDEDMIFHVRDAGVAIKRSRTERRRPTKTVNAVQDQC